MAQLKIGFAGIAGHCGVILRGLPQLPEVSIAAIAAEPEGKAREAGFREHEAVTGDTIFYDEYRVMLEKEDLDIVGVFDIDGRRAQVLRDCARAGCHIVTEKPLGMNLDEFAAVREAVGSAGVQMTMLLTMRNSPVYAAARKVVRDGLIGEIAQITGQKSYKLGRRPEWMKSRRTFSGAIPFVGIHMIDLMRWISGRDFVSGTSLQGNVAKKDEIREMDDNAGALMLMDNGGSATLRVDFLRPAGAATHGDDRVRFAGGKGVLEVRGAEHFIRVITADGEFTQELPDETPFFVQFVQSLRGEAESPVSAEDACRATEICLRLRDAGLKGEIAPLKG